MMSPHTPFMYDTKFKQCVFENPAVIRSNKGWRVRVLTYEDAKMLDMEGFLKPIDLPAKLIATTEVKSWCAALRLCAHDARPDYAAAAVAAGRMHNELVQFTKRNDEGNMMPLPCWVSSGELQNIGILACMFLGRVAPLWIGSLRLLVFYDDEAAAIAEKPEDSDTSLADFLETELGNSNFDKNMLLQWKNDVKSWKRQLTEMHHANIEVDRLMSEGKALVMNFDVNSLTQLLPGGRSEAFEVYRELADGAMMKSLGNSSPSSKFVEKFFCVVMMCMEKHLNLNREAFDQEATMHVLECASMCTIECFAEDDAKRAKRKNEQV